MQKNVNFPDDMDNVCYIYFFTQLALTMLRQDAHVVKQTARTNQLLNPFNFERDQTKKLKLKNTP